MYVIKKDDLYLEWFDGYTVKIGDVGYSYHANFKHYSLTTSLKKAIMFEDANEALSLIHGIPCSTIKKLSEV